MALSSAKIISYNLYGETVCASAARISTTAGSAEDIFEKSSDIQKNRDLIGKVLASGHTSIMEHAVFTIAFTNVSVFVEQFFIECRLASFTVKSRRYVDFGNMGYHVPEDLDKESRSFYTRYMDTLFSAYRVLLENGVPKEDARFLLPYSFHSNFYCTVNARELLKALCAIQYGRYSRVDELARLAGQILEQLDNLFPCLRSQLDACARRFYRNDCKSAEHSGGDVEFFGADACGRTALLQAPSNPEHLLALARQYAYPESVQAVNPRALFLSDRPRELEQLSYTFSINHISLSGITHLCRHRLQSVIIPSISEISYNKLILPATIQSNPVALDTYTETLRQAVQSARTVSSDSALSKHIHYFAFSGSLTDVMTTMNGRELAHFIRLRSCNRAQWEIRNIALHILRLLRDASPDIFAYVGPSCFMYGKCPEGKMSCGKFEEVVRSFTPSRDSMDGQENR